MIAALPWPATHQSPLYAQNQPSARCSQKLDQQGSCTDSRPHGPAQGHDEAGEVGFRSAPNRRRKLTPRLLFPGEGP